MNFVSVDEDAADSLCHCCCNVVDGLDYDGEEVVDDDRVVYL